MHDKTMTAFRWLLLIKVPLISCLTSDIEDCLLAGKVWYGTKAKCFSLLEQGPCPRGKHMVLGPQFEGILIMSILCCKLFLNSPISGLCQDYKKCRDGEIEIIGTDAVSMCACPEGEVKHEGVCRELFLQGSCSVGAILVPKKDEFSLCPEHFECVEHNKCEPYILARDEVEVASGSRKSDLKAHLKNLVCNKKEKKICCPQKNSLLSASNIVRSFLWKEPEGECVDIDTYVRQEPAGPTPFGIITRRQRCGRRKKWNPYSRRCRRIY